MSNPIKLIAQSEEDLAVISTLLQDTAVRIGDIAWLPAEKRFAFVGNRYRWEKKKLFRRPKGERIRTAFHLNGITAAHLLGLDLSNSDTVLDLLNVEAHETEAGYSLLLNFSGGAAIRLQTEAIDAIATDLSESWEAIARPSHD
ncbi:MAG: DUF2948 family protein [Kordiimonas sp.]